MKKYIILIICALLNINLVSTFQSGKIYKKNEMSISFSYDLNENFYASTVYFDDWESCFNDYLFLNYNIGLRNNYELYINLFIGNERDGYFILFGGGLGIKYQFKKLKFIYNSIGLDIKAVVCFSDGFPGGFPQINLFYVSSFYINKYFEPYTILKFQYPGDFGISAIMGIISLGIRFNFNNIYLNNDCIFISFEGGIYTQFRRKYLLKYFSINLGYKFGATSSNTAYPTPNVKNL